jgi:uncharacterized protein YbjT (DUF2867 family)
MKVVVFGATGKTGGLVVDRALANGHEVTVLVRDSAKFTKPGVRVLTGNATNPSDVIAAVHGQHAVIDTIGGTTPWKATELETTCAHNMIDAMHEEHVPRLIVVSMMGIGESLAQAPFWYKHLLMPTFLHGSTADKTSMEAAVIASGLQYVIARPPILKDDPPTGSFTILSSDATGHSITRADLADFLVAQIDAPGNLGHAVTVVNK